MRLPQSCSQSLSIRVVFLVFIILIVISGAQATTPQLQCLPASLKFGTVAVGQSETQLIAVTNTSSSDVTISSISADDSEFSQSGLSLPAVLTPGQTVSLNVVFAPQQDGWTGGKITLTNNGSDSNVYFPVAGTGVNSESVTATPSSLSFGQVQVGSATTLSVVLTNQRTWNVTLSTMTTAGSGFSVSGPATPFVLAPGEHATLKVSFSPEASGLVGGSIFFTGPGLNIPLTGAGIMIGQLSVAPVPLNFGSVDVGATGTQSLTMSATGGSVTISSASSSKSQFTVPGGSFPLTLNAGQSTVLNVAFSPTQSGSSSGNLTFSSNASNGQVSESLAGTGVVPQYTVNLSWTPSASSVAGYNVYRGTSVGSYTKINTSLDPNTNYADGTVASGTTYYYAAAAVNSSGEESSYSSPIEVNVP
jgi:hypothetical protein